MATCASFQVQMASIMEVLTKTALAEITKLVDDAYAALRLEMCRSQRENEVLKSKLLVMEGELRPARGCEEGTQTLTFEVKVCDEFREAQISKFAGKGSIVGVERVFDERLSTVPAKDEQYVPVENKKTVPDALEMKCEPIDGEQDWSESVLLSEDWLEEDPKTSQSQLEQKIGEGPLCKEEEEELHMQPCPAGDPEKRLQAELKQEPEGEPFTPGHPLPGSAVGLEPVDGEQDWSESVLLSQDWLVEDPKTSQSQLEQKIGEEDAYGTSGAAAANGGEGEGPLCNEEEELHMQPCPAGDPEKRLQAELKQELEGEPLTPGLPQSGSAEGLEVQCAWSKATRSGKVLKNLRHHGGGLKRGGALSNNRFSPHHFRASRRLRSEKNEGPTSHLEQRQNGRPRRSPDGIFTEMAFPLGSRGERAGSAPCEESFICTCCGKTFPDTLELQAHEEQHHAGRPHSCDECGKRFPHLGYLKFHQRMHTGERPHSCDECGKSFAHLDHLKFHQRVHTGEKPHSCNECGKSFAHLNNLKIHQRIHTGERPHSCDRAETIQFLSESFSSVSHTYSL